MIGNQTLKELLQNQPSGLELARQEEENLEKEIDVLARILLDAAKERRRNGRAN